MTINDIVLLCHIFKYDIISHKLLFPDFSLPHY